ncbi:protein FAM210B, mitochondrial [Sebastes umbrosus]|uniref:protein FAM210B, mitochondrial n=1 Tax=Sebastes umbrosus TaxID=72105 RepID=UPI00189EB327|nr:protein FAM210B, mitochondrial [Sebastes umbrosus]
MFLCRSGRLSAAALDQAFRSTGSFLEQQVRADRLRDVSMTLRNKGYALLRYQRYQRYRRFCVSLVHLEKQQQQQQPDRQPVHSARAFHRLSAIAVNLSRRVQSEGGHVDVITQQQLGSRGGQKVGYGLFTGDCWGVYSPLFSFSTGTMQTRGLSTRKSEEETANNNNKGGEQNLKEASTISSSTAKAPGEPEPEGGKPNKTQQLKQVFKEYGAVGVSFHIAISLMSLGMFYLLISSGIDMAAVLCKVGFSEAVVQSKMAAGTSTFVLAYAIHKLFAPVRISITLVSVPLIVRYFRKTGQFKPPTPAP